MRALIKALIMLVILYFLTQAGAMLISTTYTQVLSASNTTNVADKMTPLLSGWATVFQAVAAIFGIGIFVVLFAILFGGGRDDSIKPYQY